MEGESMKKNRQKRKGGVKQNRLQTIEPLPADRKYQICTVS